MTKFLIVGAGGRECAIAKRLSEDTRLYAVMSHENPYIADLVRSSGGQYLVENHSDPGTVADFAAGNSVDWAFVNSDEPLANGVVDALLAAGINAVGGTKEAARIEWDKIYGIELVRRLCPEFTPFFTVVYKRDQIRPAISEFQARNLHVVVKPQGLTGGKGVKVMPEHLKAYEDCEIYATSLLEANPGRGVLLVEKLHGIEFTIMGLTDGRNLVLSPASYDYPFRYEGDRGPGTGGMGCFTDKETLPFMTGDDLDSCRTVMQRTLDDMRQRGIAFNGVLNGGFFKTAQGIRFMEFNGRLGDPEGISTLCTIKGSFSKTVQAMHDGTLSADTVGFKDTASVVKYLVAPEYPDPSLESTIFDIDEQAISEMHVGIFPAACKSIGHGRYRTLKGSRVMAFAALSDDIDEASSRINAAIDVHVTGDLEYRRDIGSQKSLDKLADTAQKMTR